MASVRTPSTLISSLALDQILMPPVTAWADAVPGGFQGTSAALRASGAMLEQLVHSKPDIWFDTPFSYSNTRGDALHHVPGPVLSHVFNHATHHRGQASAAVTMAGEEAPVMDLLYYELDGA